jgi:hypothetical protein
MAILFMKRDPIQIVVSCIRFGAKIHPWVANWTMIVNPQGIQKGWKLDISPYEKNRKKCADLWKKKARFYTECQIEEMDTFEKRLKFFKELKRQGWPINPGKAALVDNDENQRIELRGRKVLWT